MSKEKSLILAALKELISALLMYNDKQHELLSRLNHELNHIENNDKVVVKHKTTRRKK